MMILMMYFLFNKFVDIVEKLEHVHKQDDNKNDMPKKSVKELTLNVCLK